MHTARRVHYYNGKRYVTYRFPDGKQMGFVYLADRGYYRLT